MEAWKIVVSIFVVCAIFAVLVCWSACEVGSKVDDDLEGWGNEDKGRWK